jgi:hypothetical protein
MTPTPGKRSILDTNFNAVPSDTRPGGSLWDANVRVGTEMKQTYQDTPPIVGPAARQWIGNQGWLGRNILGPVADAGDAAYKGTAAVGAGVLANLSEIASGGDPKLARDVHAALSIARRRSVRAQTDQHAGRRDGVLQAADQNGRAV